MADQPLLPPGFRFHPTDEELVTYYLARKLMDPSFKVHAISEVDLNKCEPWDLPEKAKMGEKEWYFFSLRDRKYPTGMRTNRATEAGYWKATGKDKDVVTTSSSSTNPARRGASGMTPRLVGMKKTLVFYLGRAPKGEKTNWIMHEYRSEDDTITTLHHHHHHHSPRLSRDEWVVCRIFQKNVGMAPTPARMAHPGQMSSVPLPVSASIPAAPNHPTAPFSFFPSATVQPSDYCNGSG
ncbi:unnamed protein product, partial [Sphagnum jensenii]